MLEVSGETAVIVVPKVLNESGTYRCPWSSLWVGAPKRTRPTLAIDPACAEVIARF
jgi:hypothetical protein